MSRNDELLSIVSNLKGKFQDSDIFEVVSKSISVILSVTVDDLARTDLGKHDLSDLEIETALNEIQSVCKKINEFDLTVLYNSPNRGNKTDIKKLFDVLTSIINMFERFFQYDVVIHDANEKNNLSKMLNGIRDRVNTEILPVLRNLKIDNLEYEDIIGNYQRSVDEFKIQSEKFVNSLISDLDKKNREVDKIVEDMSKKLKEAEESLKEIGLSRHTEYFSEEAETHKKSCKKWLTWTLITGFAIIGFAVFVFIFTISSSFLELETNQIIQLVVTKALIFSILYFFLVMCLKNYKAHKHNFVTNMHKARILQTFGAFSESVDEDAQTKNVILMKASESIFQHDISGFLSKECSTPSNPQIFEIIRDIAKSGSFEQL